MFRIEYFMVGIVAGGVLLPFVTFAQAKVPMSTENYFYTNFLPKTGCTLEKEGSRDEVTKEKTIPVDENRAPQALVYFEFAKSSVSTYATGAAIGIGAGAGAIMGYDVINYLRSSKSGFYTCSAEAFNQIIAESKTLNFVEKMGIWLISWTTWIINSLAEWLLGFLADLILSMLRQSTYINQDFVKQGWVFIQGITNLGFIFVLLYIALATTLRIESVGTSIQSLLPKLLIGALLVNFSLIIGGFFIDASRLLMAIELNVLSQDKNEHGKTSMEALKDGLFSKSRLLEADLAKYKYQGASGAYMASIIRLVQGSVFRIVLLLAFGVIALNLLVRYITLLILLIFSPIPYLAFILPKTAKAASIWWGYFLRWVFYGPTILFFLILIINMQNIDIATDSRNNGTWMDSAAFKEFMRFIIVMSLFFVGNKLSKKIAGDVGDIVMSGAKRTGSFIRNNPKTAMIAAGAATGGLGFLAGAGAAAGTAALGSRTARDFYKGVGSNLKESKMVKPVRKFLGVGKRNDKGELMPGESSWTSSLAGTLTDRFNVKKQNDIADVQTLMDATSGLLMASPKSEVALMPSKLSQKHVVLALGETDAERDANIKIIIEDGSQSQRMALAKNKDYIAGLKPADLAKLQKVVQDAPNVVSGVAGGVSDRDKTAVIEQMFKTFDDIESKKKSK